MKATILSACITNEVFKRFSPVLASPNFYFLCGADSCCLYVTRVCRSIDAAWLDHLGINFTVYWDRYLCCLTEHERTLLVVNLKADAETFFSVVSELPVSGLIVLANAAYCLTAFALRAYSRNRSMSAWMVDLTTRPRNKLSIKRPRMPGIA